VHEEKPIPVINKINIIKVFIIWVLMRVKTIIPLPKWAIMSNLLPISAGMVELCVSFVEAFPPLKSTV
jgi:hypothetical protein